MKMKNYLLNGVGRLVLAASLLGSGLVFVPSVANAIGLTAHQSGGPKPTIVLVHGAWADGDSWDGVIAILQREGYTVDAPPNPLQGLTSDSTFLASYLSTISGPIVLVGHSYGGAVITNAATGNTSVKALVYDDAFAPAQGETVQQLVFAKPGTCLGGGGKLANVFNEVVPTGQSANDPDLYLKVQPGTDYLGFDKCFANDVATNEAHILGATQQPLALNAFTQKSGVPAWKTIPSWSIIGTQDQAIPPAELTFMAKRANSHITYVKAGHLSLVSDPSAVAGVIVKAANASS
jgi:pimeloyl-ACP methyl ester carboxylesterase